jgi:GAF domain-containing protein
MAFVSRRDGDGFRYVTAVGSTPETTAEATLFQKTVLEARRFVIGRDTMTGRVLLEGHALQIPDLASDQEYKIPESLTVAKARTLLGVPLLREAEPIGVMSLTRQRVEPFTEQQIDLVKTFADQAVIAIENARLLNELRQRTTDLTESLEQQTAISDILRVISNSPSDVQPVLASVAEHAARICKAQFANIAIVENGFLRVAMRFGAVGRPVGEQIPLDRSTIVGRSIIDMEPIQVADLQEASDEFALGRQYATEIGYRAVLGVPLIREGRALGSIAILRTEVGSFEQKHVALLSTFADQAAIATSNKRTFSIVVRAVRH